MNQYPLWRYLLIVALIVVGVIYALPNVYGEDPSVQVTTRNSTPFPADIVTTLKSTLKSQQIPYIAIDKEKNAYLIRFHDNNDQLKAQSVIQATIGPDYSVALNLAPRTPAWLLAIGATPMKLGLDLRGGVHFLLKIDVDSLIMAREKADMHSIANLLREKMIRYTGMVGPIKGKGFLIRFRNSDDQQTALALLRKQYADFLFSAQTENDQPVIVANMTQNAVVQAQKYSVEQNLTILRTRVAQLGITEPVIQQQGADQISVDLPGIQDMARAKNLIGKMATIRFQLVSSKDAVTAARTGIVPFGTQLFKDEYGQPILLKDQVILSGSSIINANPTIDQSSGKPAVSIRIGGSVVSSFNKITRDNIGKQLATVLIENQSVKKMVDGKVVTQDVKTEKVINHATIQSALPNTFNITGLQSMQYANNLALLLRSGAYTARMAFIEERVIGPSLGKQNVEMGELSLLIGSILVIVFMMLYYRLFGLVANVALILNVIFIVACLSIVGATLSLPGIAAIVLTVGIAVDANVLINERIREELRNGNSPQASIHTGYGRAFSTIVDANVTTLIVAVILLALASTTVQSFAVALIIGILASMVTAIFITRAIINLIYGGRVVKRLSIGIKVSKG